jgi:GDPmannose 4,6-dehydratase
MNPMRRALIIGAGGQDGTLLTRALQADGVDVVGLLSDGRVTGDIEGIPSRAPLADADAVYALVRVVRPDAVFYLPAYHAPAEGPGEPDIVVWKKSFAVHTDGLLHVLDACVAEAPHAHVVYASTAQVFGHADSAPQDERTPLRPRSPFSVSKVAGMNICRACREKGVRASVAILFHHESALRPRHFVSQRIAYAVAQAQLSGEPLARVELASPDTQTDWLAAEDAVAALRAIAEQPTMDDYVVASGQARTARELAAAAAAYAGVSLEMLSGVHGHASVPAPLVGNTTKLRERTGWAPRVPFESWVARMVDAAREDLTRRARGPLA